MVPSVLLACAFATLPARGPDMLPSGIRSPAEMEQRGKQMKAALASSLEWHIKSIDEDLAYLKKRNGSQKTINLLEQSKKEAQAALDEIKKR